MSSLFEAVKSGNFGAVENLLKAESDLESRDANGDTALHCAARTGNEEIVKILLSRGADKNATNKISETPLHEASKFGHRNVVAVLLKNAIFIDAKNQCDFTPLHLASAKGKSEIVKILLENGADYKMKNKSNETPYELCANDEDTAKAFLDAKTLSQTEKINLLLKATEADWPRVVENLLKTKINVNDSNGKSSNALVIAAELGNNKIMQKLLKYGADVNATNKYNFNLTALHYACEIGNLEAVKLLIKYEADLEAVLLLQSSSITTPIWCAVLNNHFEIVEYLWEHGASIHVKDDTGKNLLHCCANGNHFKIAELLLEKGMSVDAFDGADETPLSFACKNGSAQTVKVLLKNGADLKVKCEPSFRTPLHKACEIFHKNEIGNYCEIVKLLLLHGADVAAKDKYDLTPPDVARLNDAEEIVNIFKSF